MRCYMYDSETSSGTKNLAPQYTKLQIFMVTTTGLLIRWRFHICLPRMQQESQTPHLSILILLHSNNIVFDPITKLFLRTVFVQVPSLLISCMNGIKTNTAQSTFYSSLY